MIKNSGECRIPAFFVFIFVQSMKSIQLKAYAKINIGLDITGRRADGYHLLKTCMQTISLHDVITVSGAGEDQKEQIRITSNNPAVPKGEANIAFKAAKLLMDEAGINSRLVIDIQKNIPMAAGLAGGSTDGAAVLKAVNELFCLNLTTEELSKTAAKLGADVPFCLRKGLWLCEGIGEILTPLPALKGLCAVIVKPDFEVSTAWCYKEYDALKDINHPDMDGLIAAANAGDINGVCECMGNVLELATGPAHPEIEEMKRKFISCGARCALMSGSGGTVFGLFADEEKAARAAEYFKGYPAAEYVGLADLIY